MMTLRSTRGPVLLTLWAFAPPIVLSPADGDTISISFGAVAGQYELISRSCEGEVTSSEGVPLRTGAIHVEYVSGDSPVRISAFGGRTAASNAFSDVFDGRTFGGGVIAYEGDHWGLGAGPVLLPGPDLEAAPSLYLRIGDREGAYLQGDVFAPTPIPGATGLIRGGVGFSGERVRGLAGLSSGRDLDLSGEANGGPFAELSLGLTPSFEALLGASWYPAEVHSDWGMGVGARWRIGF